MYINIYYIESASCYIPTRARDLISKEASQLTTLQSFLPICLQVPLFVCFPSLECFAF